MSEEFLNQDAPPSSPPQEVYVDEEEEEIDELVSDEEPEPAVPISRSPSPIEREEGTSLLPVNKMEEIIHANALPNMLALSKEALFLVSIATEEFVKKMTRSGLLKATAEQRTSVNYPDMSYVTQQYQEFMFLQELIPAPITLAEALELRQEKEKEITLQDPALTVQAVSTPASSPPPSAIVRQLPPVPIVPASTSQSARAPRTRAKSTNPKKTQAADPNSAPAERDRSGVPQHMQHQMQMQLNGDFSPGPGGVAMQVDMSNSTVSRSSSRSTKGKRKEAKAPTSSKRRKTAPTPGSSTSNSPPPSNGSRSTSITPASYMPPPPIPLSSGYTLDFAASSASAPRKKETNPIPSHLLDPQLLNGGGSYTPSPPATAVPGPLPTSGAGAHWPIQAEAPQPLNNVLGGGVGGRTIYSNTTQR